VDHRRLGFALVVLGLVGVLVLSVLGAAGPAPRRSQTYGPGWMRDMHGWMHGWWGWGPGGVAAPSPSPGAREVRVRMDEYAFSPSRIELRAGETVNLVLANEGALPHDLTIPALGFALGAAPGATAEAALTAPAPGTYPFFCSVPGHRQLGMVGTLVVS
jgi:nitrite reductase (NO-forming)